MAKLDKAPRYEREDCWFESSRGSYVPLAGHMVFESTVGLSRQVVTLLSRMGLAGSIPVIHPFVQMVKLVDAPGLEPGARKGVWVRIPLWTLNNNPARVVKLVDAPDRESGARKGVQVQLLLRAQHSQ